MAVEKKVRRYKRGNNRKIDSRRVRKRVSHESRDKYVDSECERVR